MKEKRPNPATFSVSPRPGEKRVSRKLDGKHLYWNVSKSVVAVKGDARFIATTDGFFGRDRNYGSANTLHNPTWGQVFEKFKESIPVTGDYHHCYLEGIRRLNKNALDGCPLYEFVAGS